MIWLTFFLLSLLGLSLYALAPVLTPFVTGIVLAYLLDPIVERMDAKGFKRQYASAVPVFIFFSAFFALFIFAVPLLIEDVQQFISRTPEYMSWAEQTLTGDNNVFIFLEKFGIHLTLEDLRSKLMTYTGHISQITLHAAKSTAIGALALVDLLSFLCLTPLVMFYILMDWPQFVETLKKRLPQTLYTPILEIFSEIDTKMNALVRGQLMVALSLGLFYGVALSISGLQMGFLIGLMTGLLSIIPFAGFLIGLIATICIALIQYQFVSVNPYLILIAIFIAGQLLESIYLTPKLLGENIGLHPVWVIFALMAGSHLLGLLGMLLALPVAIIVQVILPRLLHKWAKTVDRNMEKKA